MTEQEFIPSNFVEVSQDVAELGASVEGASTPEASEIPSTSGFGAAGPPEPEANASTSKCPIDQADPNPE